MEKQWMYRYINKDERMKFEQDTGFSPIVAQLLINRSITTKADAETFIYPSFSLLHNPDLMHGIAHACLIIEEAIDDDKNIWIYGDYDTDGTTSTTLLIDMFNHLNKSVNYHIPNRFTEGYGVNKEAIKSISEQGCDLLLTVDCGITSVDEIAYANTLGIQVIVIDHHQPKNELPNSEIISPRLDDSYPFKDLAGVGLAYKLSSALIGEENAKNQLDLVALGTIADVVPLVGENRVLTQLGLIEINKRKRLGLDAISYLSDRDVQEIKDTTIAFSLAPQINAAGRMSEAREVVELLTSKDVYEVTEISQRLKAYNKERKDVEQQVTQEAITQIERHAYNDDCAIVVNGEGWHQGVIGIVASKIVDKYNKPTFIISENDGIGHGSGRSIENFNLVGALQGCENLLVKFGGHQAAAGITIESSNIEKLRERINTLTEETLKTIDTIPINVIDFQVRLESITPQFIEEINRLQPFGEGNPKPNIATCGLSLVEPPIIMGKHKNHIKMRVTDGGTPLTAIGWNMAHKIDDIEDEIDITFKPEMSEWQYGASLQLILTDFRNHL